MLQTLLDIDSQLLLFFNSFHTPFLDSFMMLFTGRFIWIPMYAAILPILFKKYRPALAVMLLLGLIATIVLTDQTCATYIRPYVQRLRPSNLDNPLSQFVTVVNGYRGGSYGFPSCHAANSFALAVFISLVVRRRIFIAFIFSWALFNSYSRMYLGVHYPTDILAGAVIGAAFAMLTYRATCLLAGHILAKHHLLKSDLWLFTARIHTSAVKDITIRMNAVHVMISIAAVITSYMLLAAMF